VAFTPITPFSFVAPRPSDANEWTPLKLPKASSGPSLNQLVAMIMAKQQKPHRSLVGSLLHAGKEAVDPVVWAFDKLERPAYGVANAIDKGVSSGTLSHPGSIHPGAMAHGFREGFMGRQKTNFGAVMAHHGVLDHHSVVRGLAGVGLDVALDPLSYTGVGMARKAGTKALEEASQLVLKGPKYTHSAAEAESRLINLAHAKDVLKEGGEPFQHRHALSKLMFETNARVAGGHELTEATRAEINVARELAHTESKVFDQKYLKFRFGPNSGGLNVNVTKLPMTRLGDANIPVLSKVGASLGKAFRPGYENPILHQQQLGAKHLGERLMTEYTKKTSRIFQQAKVAGLTAKEQRDVLHFFEKPKGTMKAVLKDKKTGEFVLNEAHVQRALKAGFSEKQIAFVRAMHDTSEFLAKQHREYGLEFEHLGAKGKLYVPHIVQKSGEGLTDSQRNLLTKRGFVKGRKNELSVAQLHSLYEAGKLPHDIETDPYRLLGMHVRSVAQQHADQTVINYATHTFGVPTRLVDKAALSAVQAKRAAAEKVIPAFDEEAHQQAIKDLMTKHEALAREQHAAAVKATTDRIKYHLEEAPWTQTTMATVKRLSQHNVNLGHRLSENIQAIREQRNPGLLKELNPLKAQKVEHDQAVLKQAKSIKALAKQERKILRGTKNPEVVADTMRTITNKNLRNEFGHKIAFKAEIADNLERMEKVTSGDPNTLKAFANSYRKWLGVWKVGVTTINPAYGFRNTLSDFWNMYLSGVPMHAMPVYGAKAAKLMVQASHGNEHAASILKEAYDHGILSGLFAGDIQQVAEMMEHGTPWRVLAKDKRVVKAFAKATQDINRNRENWGRLTHYMYRLDQGKGVAEASDLVKAAHFDYEDLTDFESKGMKLLAPFYTWSRKNIPFQIRAMYEHPGQMAAFPQFAQEMSQAAGGEQPIVPSYFAQNMLLRMPGGRYYNPMIGVMDLENAAHPQQLLGSLMTPAAKVPLELAFNKNLMTGQAIADPTSYSRNPVNDKLAGLLGLIPGANVGMTGRKKGDKMVHGMGASPYLTYLAGTTPLSNMLVNRWGSKIKNAQHPNDMNRWWQTELLGINGQTVNDEEQKQFALLSFNDKMKQIMKDLRAEGLIPPAKAGKKSAQEKVLESILFHQLGG
jgi:hypothetical protein